MFIYVLLVESSTYDPSERSYGSRHKTDKPTVKAMSNKSDSDKDGNGQDDDDDDDVLVETDELMELKKQWAKTQGVCICLCKRVVHVYL